MSGRSLALSLILLGCSSGSEPSKPAPPEPGPAAAPEPATYEVLGATLEVELLPTQPAIMISEPIYVRAVIHNRSDVPLVMQASWMGRNGLGRPENYQLEATDAAGTAVPIPDAGPQMGGKSWEVELTRAKPFEANLFLPSWAPFATPGNYQLRFGTTLQVRDPAGTDWTELPVATMAPLTVVADDDAKLAQLIERLATRAAAPDSDHEDLRVLGTIRDPRVVPHLAALMTSNQYPKRFQAAVVLGTWNDDRALAALKGAMTTQASDLDPAGYTTDELREQSAAQLRLTIAQALSSSPHPDARDLLLSMKADPYSGVRLTVVHALSTVDPARAKPLLQTFAKDPDPMVAGEAKRYLA
ncbi:MAG TPA: HEAT repeat domain-containing protein, partial [Kofleriaceae bacterium]|nr:HEAT repeat domain-containing protein [Kofleriaceae bacterium]